MKSNICWSVVFLTVGIGALQGSDFTEKVLRVAPVALAAVGTGVAIMDPAIRMGQEVAGRHLAFSSRGEIFDRCSRLAILFGGAVVGYKSVQTLWRMRRYYAAVQQDQAQRYSEAMDSLTTTGCGILATLLGGLNVSWSLFYI